MARECVGMAVACSVVFLWALGGLKEVDRVKRTLGSVTTQPAALGQLILSLYL